MCESVDDSGCRSDGWLAVVYLDLVSHCVCKPTCWYVSGAGSVGAVSVVTVIVVGTVTEWVVEVCVVVVDIECTNVPSSDTPECLDFHVSGIELMSGEVSVLVIIVTDVCPLD